MENKQHEFHSWNDDINQTLCRDSLIALMRNEIPFLSIANFATPSECERLVQQATAEGFSAYRDVEPKINRIGNTVFEYNSISKDEYFEKNIEKLTVQKRIFDSSFNPIERFIDLLNGKTGYPVRIAKGANGEDYYAGLIRRIEDGTHIHVDYAPAEQPDWEVGNVTHQLTWNLYLRTTRADDGKIHIFNRQWSRGDDRYKEGSYGYNPLIVEGAEHVNFEPVVGEIVIFNTRNFHYVEATAGERVTVTSAIGRLPSDELVLWS